MLRRSFLKLAPVAAIPLAGVAAKHSQDASWLIDSSWAAPQCRYCAYVQCRYVEGEINHLRHYLLETHIKQCKRFKFNGKKYYMEAPE